MMSGLISFNSSSLKTPIRRKDLGDLYMLAYSLFCVKFRCHGNGVTRDKQFSVIIQQPDTLQKTLLGARILVIFSIQVEL